jgi:hypothetical protein
MNIVEFSGTSEKTRMNRTVQREKERKNFRVEEFYAYLIRQKY